MNDQTAQMGFQIGQSALKHGQDYVDQNVRIGKIQGGNLWIYTDDSNIAKPLHPPPSLKTLLQCLNPLRPPQTPPRPLPLAP